MTGTAGHAPVVQALHLTQKDGQAELTGVAGLPACR